MDEIFKNDRYLHKGTIMQMQLLDKGERYCSKCKEIKPLSEFSKDKHNRMGYKSWCKVCVDISKRIHYARNKAKYQEKGREKYKRMAGYKRPNFTEFKVPKEQKCPLCDTVKPIDEFNLDKTKITLHDYRCKTCRYQQYKARNNHRRVGWLMTYEAKLEIEVLKELLDRAIFLGASNRVLDLVTRCAMMYHRSPIPFIKYKYYMFLLLDKEFAQLMYKDEWEKVRLQIMDADNPLNIIKKFTKK